MEHIINWIKDAWIGFNIMKDAGGFNIPAIAVIAFTAGGLLGWFARSDVVKIDEEEDDGKELEEGDR
ncbi:MAG: hypothetical protein RR296_11935 [Clostridia bacterium]